MIAIAFLELCILCIYYFVVFFVVVVVVVVCVFFFCFFFSPTGIPVAFQGKMASIEFCYPCTQVTNENMRGSWDSMGDPSTWGSIDMHLKKMYSRIEHDRWHRERDTGLSVWPKDKTVVCVGVPGCPLSKDNQEEHRAQRSRWTLFFPLRNLDK